MIEEFLNSNLYAYIVGIVIFLLCFIYTISPYLEVSNGIDLQIEIVPVPFEKISDTHEGESSATIRQRVIADLAGSDNIECTHIAEAIGYRNLDRESWGT